MDNPRPIPPTNRETQSTTTDFVNMITNHGAPNGKAEKRIDFLLPIFPINQAANKQPGIEPITKLETIHEASA